MVYVLIKYPSSNVSNCVHACVCLYLPNLRRSTGCVCVCFASPEEEYSVCACVYKRYRVCVCFALSEEEHSVCAYVCAYVCACVYLPYLRSTSLARSITNRYYLTFKRTHTTRRTPVSTTTNSVPAHCPLSACATYDLVE